MALQSPAQKREEELEKKLQEIKLKEKEEQYAASAEKFGLPFSTLRDMPIDADALSIVTEEVARKSNLAILYKNESKLIIAIVNPEDPATKETLESLKNSGFTTELKMTTPEILQSVWKRYKLIKPRVFRTGAVEINEEELTELQEQIRDINDLKTKLTAMSVTKLLEVFIAGALKTRASDIHFESESSTTRLRYRLDGILNDITVIDRAYYKKILNRVKVLSKLKLNIHDSPQEGRFTIKQKSVDIEVRVSILPSEFGETIVMRLLDPRTIKINMDNLGMRRDIIELAKSQLKKKTGSVLTSGPTGAGKTTTLYAFVNYLNQPGIKIITIEDPIEYHVKNISQTQVDSKRGYNFDNGLQAIIRQDPDVILVGEIRDAKTAETALHAALTGHLVLSTIHTNSAASIVPRLIDLGIKPQIIAPAINMVMAQRLLRRLCTKCRVMKKPSVEVLQKIKSFLGPIKDRLGLPPIDASLKIYSAAKCAECDFSGHKGRVGIFEAFIFSKNIEKLTMKSPAISEVEEMAISEGMITILQDAYIKLIEGTVSIEEIERVIS